MTLRVPAASIAPDLRFGAAGALADPLSGLLIGDVALHAQGCLPYSPAIPCYLRYADRDAIVVADGIDEPGELESCLAEEIRDTAEIGSFDDLSSAVIVLDGVDRCFRKSGLWPGNIYLAGAGALAVVLDLVEDGGPARRGPEAVLRELAALELAYLFPVAGKFRAGEYDGEIQYRLNGWGRALAKRLTAGRAGTTQAGVYWRKISQHLAGERGRYASFLSELDVARQDYCGNRLEDALMLPIPVLV